MWVPPEDKDPILLMAPTRKSISLFGAVQVAEGRLVTQFEKSFNAITFQSFLQHLLRHRRRGKRWSYCWITEDITMPGHYIHSWKNIAAIYR